MGHKRRRWRRWERYIRHLRRLVPPGGHAKTAGLDRYIRQRMHFHNRKVERQHAEILAVFESLTGGVTRLHGHPYWMAELTGEPQPCGCTPDGRCAAHADVP